jgi:hypothetical protein
MFDSPTAESDYWMDPDRDTVHLTYSPAYGWIAYSHEFGKQFRTLHSSRLEMVDGFLLMSSGLRG